MNSSHAESIKLEVAKGLGGKKQKDHLRRVVTIEVDDCRDIEQVHILAEVVDRVQG